MELGLNGKVVLVLASSKGLGKGIALEYAKEKAKVMLASRKEAELIKTKQEIIEATGNTEVEYVVCDVANGADLEHLMNETIAKFGTIDVLINNAGGPPAGTFESFTDEDWEQAFELTLLSFVRTIRKTIPIMRKQGWGRIINITSSSTKQIIPGLVLSNTFRTGVVGLTKTLSHELGPDQILINCVGPGRIETDRILELDSIKAEQLSVSMEEVQNSFSKNIPLQRYGKPDEFAKLVVYLGSPANSYITGQSILIDGGMTTSI